MSFPSPPPGNQYGPGGYLHPEAILRHHLTDTYWMISTVVLGVWCVGLGVWATHLHRKAR